MLGLLPSAPAAALRTLEAIGGRRTVEVLAQGIGLGKEELASASGSANSAANPAAGSQGDGDAAAVVPHLRAVRHHALEVLWLLNEDPELRRRILGRLDPTDLPDRVAADLGGPDDRELALLSSHLDPARPVTALCRLAANGNAATLPVLADLLLRIVAEVADRRDPDGREPASPADRRRPARRPPACRTPVRRTPVRRHPARRPAGRRTRRPPGGLGRPARPGRPAARPGQDPPGVPARRGRSPGGR